MDVEEALEALSTAREAFEKRIPRARGLAEFLKPAIDVFNEEGGRSVAASEHVEIHIVPNENAIQVDLRVCVTKSRHQGGKVWHRAGAKLSVDRDSGESKLVWRGWSTDADAVGSTVLPHDVDFTEDASTVLAELVRVVVEHGASRLDGMNV